MSRNLRIEPFRGSTASGEYPHMIFAGLSASTIELEVLDDGSIQFTGTQGSLLGISDDLSGSLLSANDISGLPVFEVFATDKIIGGKFGENTWVINSEQISIGSQTADSSAILDIGATTSNSVVRGMLTPRVTTANRDTITSPATGLFLFNTTDGKFQFYTGATWSSLDSQVAGVTGIDGSGSANQVTYFVDSDTVTSSSNFTFDGDDAVFGGNATITNLGGSGTVMVIADNTGILGTQSIPAGADGDGIYAGSGNVPSATVATLTDYIEFSGTTSSRIDLTNGSNSRAYMGIGADYGQLVLADTTNTNTVILRGTGASEFKGAGIYNRTIYRLDNSSGVERAQLAIGADYGQLVLKNTSNAQTVVVRGTGDVGFNTSGNFGIGTLSPATLFHINATSVGTGLLIRNGSSNLFSVYNRASGGGIYVFDETNTIVIALNQGVDDYINTGHGFAIGDTSAITGSQLSVVDGDVSIYQNSDNLLDNSTLDSQALVLRGYYDNNGATGPIGIAFVDATIEQLMTDTAPTSKMSFKVATTERLAIYNSGEVEIDNLGGGGTLMVVTDNVGLLSTQAIPSIGGNGGTVSGTTNSVAMFTATTTVGDGSWSFTGNTLYPDVDGADIGITGTNRIGTIFMSSIIDYATDLNFVSSGATAMTIETGGNVGIGVTNPSYKLHVVAGGTEGLIVSTTGATNNLVVKDLSSSSFVGIRTNARASIFTAEALRVKGAIYSDIHLNVKNISLVTSGSGHAKFGSAQTGQNAIFFTSVGTDDIQMITGAVTQIHIDGTTAKIGFDTQTPAEKLTLGRGLIADAASTATQRDSNGFQVINAMWSGTMSVEHTWTTKGIASTSVDELSSYTFLHDSTERMVIQSTGEVGIGTTNPGQTLHVVGDVSFGSSEKFAWDDTLKVLHIQGSTDLNTVSNTNRTLRIRNNTGGEILEVFNGGNVYLSRAGAQTGRLFINGGLTTAILSAKTDGNTIGNRALHIQNSDSQDIVQFRSDGTSWFGNGLASSGAAIGIKGEGGAAFSVKPTATLYITGSQSGRSLVVADGSVGIGTSTPSTKLHLDGTLQLDNLGGGTVSGYVLTLQSDGTAQWEFNGTGSGSGSGTVLGTGTTNSVTMFTATDTVGDGSWSFTGNTLYPDVDGTDIGITGTNRIGTIFMSSIIDYDTAGTGLKFQEGGTDRMIIATGGNVGIGTILPSEKLHIIGNVSAAGNFVALGSKGFQIFAEGASNKGTFYRNNANTQTYLHLNRYTSDIAQIVLDSGGVQPYINWSDADGGGGVTKAYFGKGVNTANPSGYGMRTQGLNFDINTGSGTGVSVFTILANNGNVGIGVTGPSARLHVVGTTNFTTDLVINNSQPYITFKESGTTKAFLGKGVDAGLPTAYAFRTQGLDYAINTAGGIGTAAVMVKSSNGNVGIGITTPSTKLHLDGTLQLDNLGGGTASGYVLTLQSDGTAQWEFNGTGSGSSGNGGTVSGTVDSIAKFTGTKTIGDSGWSMTGNDLHPDGTTASIGTPSNRIDTIYMSSILDYSSSINFVTSGATALSVSSGYVTVDGALQVKTDLNDYGLYVQKNNGRIGTNTVNPQTIFHIHEPTPATDVFLKISSAGTGLADGIDIGFEQGLGYKIRGNDLAGLFFELNSGTGNLDVMTLLHTGNVGINNTTPTAKLQITSGTQSGDAFLVEDGDGVDLFIIEDSGNVGIGTSNPSADFVFKSKADDDLNVIFKKANDQNAFTFYFADANAAGNQFQMYNPAGDSVLKFITNTGSSYILGDLAINTTSAGGNLQIKADGTGLGDIMLRLDDSADKDMLVARADGTTVFGNGVGNAAVGIRGTGATNISGRPSATLHIKGAESGTSVIIEDGNVGIGTTSPNAKLHVVGATGSPNTDTFIVEDGDANSLFVVEQGGEVGIGTSNPTQKLHVIGGALFDGFANAKVDVTNGSNSRAYIGVSNTNDYGHLVLYNTSNAITTIIKGDNGASEFHSGLGITVNANTGQGVSVRDASGSNRAVIQRRGTGEGQFVLYTDAGVIDTLISGGATDNYILSGDLGIGTASPSTKLQVQGGARITGLGGGGTLMVITDDNGLLSTQSIPSSSGNGGTVSGTVNTVAKFTGTKTVGDSSITDNGTLITLTGQAQITSSATASDAFVVDAGTFSNSLLVQGDGTVGINRVPRAGFQFDVQGKLGATTKSFVIKHPTKAGMTLEHGVIEGPEHAVQFRGQLTNNNMIDIPDYWAGLVDIDSITVTLTPIGDYQELYVSGINPTEITVANGSGNLINCFYLVQAERKDVDKLKVEY